jgi:hypothetical protein
MATKSAQTNNQNLLGCLIKPVLLVILIIGGIYYGFSYWHSVSIPDYIRSGSSFNAWAMNLTKVKGAYTPEGPVLWLFSYYRQGKGWGYEYKLDIIDPQKKVLIKRIPFNQTTSITSSSDMSDFTLLNKQMFSANPQLGFQWRNLRNGSLEGDEKSFIQKFPQLGAGIGQIQSYSSDDMIYNLTTKDGLKYLYYAQLDKITNEDEKEKIRRGFYDQDISTFKFAKLSYVWGLSGDELRKQLVLVKQYHSIFEKIYPQSLSSFADKIKEMENYNKRLEKEKEEQAQRIERYKQYGENVEAMQKRWEEELIKDKLEKEKRDAKEQQLVMHLKDRIFLKGEIIYQDSTRCLILHSSEVSKNARHFLTCVQADGKILWEIKDNPPKILATTEDIYKSNLEAIFSKDQLMIISNVYNIPGAIGLDPKTGKTLWEFMPLE